MRQFFIGLCLIAASACGGSKQTDLDVRLASDETLGSIDNRSRDVKSRSLNPTVANDSSKKSNARRERSDTPELALNGARADLSFVGSAAKRCSCLSVSLGAPAQKDFSWDTEVPRIDQKNQTVIAFSTDIKGCASSAKASYQGYQDQDGDILVLVEAAVEGRPLMQGAIIPTPATGKAVYIVPSGSKTPGRSLDGKAERCRVSAVSSLDD